MGSDDKKDLDNDYFMNIFTKSHQCIKWYVHASIFGQVTHQLKTKIRPQLITSYENSVVET